MDDKVLIIGPSWVGDMIMSQVLFQALKSQRPQVQIDVLAPEWSRPLTERMPEINASHVSPFQHKAFHLRERIQLGRRLRNFGYQQAYVLPNSWKSAWVPFWAQIPRRVGYRGEWRYGLLTDCRVLDKQRYPKMVERYEALAYPPNAPLAHLKPALKITPDKVDAACQKFQLSRTNPILVLCPGAEFGPSKQWPSASYAKVAQHYVAKGWQVWILGSAKDSVVAKEILAHAKTAIDLTGRTRLDEAIDLMSLADKVLTNDSGLMHIASALDRPLVALYGSSSPAFTPPLSDKATILSANVACSPCFARTCPLSHHDCMRRLMVPQVIAALDGVATS